MSTTTKSNLIVIPARLASTRLPNKPLLSLAGGTVLSTTFEMAMQVPNASTIVATPDREVAEYCKARGIPVWPTDPDAPNGTARVAEVAASLRLDREIDTITNWQVDEPLVLPSDVANLIEKTTAGISTLVYALPDSASRNLVALYGTEHTVKVAVGDDGRCYWFSRALIARTIHIGIYCFRRAALQRCGRMPPSSLSKAEGLEQLTWLEQGHAINAVYTSDWCPAINTKVELNAADKALTRMRAIVAKRTPPEQP